MLLEELVPWLRAQGHVPVVTAEDQISPPGCEVVPEAELGAAIDLAVVLGGDGTMLRAARLVSDHGRPVRGARPEQDAERPRSCLNRPGRLRVVR